MKKYTHVTSLFTVVLAACTSPAPSEPRTSSDGGRFNPVAELLCKVADNGDGSKTITCDDGSKSVVRDGKDGASCTVKDAGDRTKTISCDDGTMVTVSDGTSSENGADGTNGADGENGTDGANGADGESADVTAEPPGPNCAYGGVKVQVMSGSAVYVCTGATGDDGQSAIVTGVSPGLVCSNGGVQVQVGANAPAFVCNGSTGADGQSAVVTAESAGTHCALGGVQVQVGSGDPTYVCNGASGADGLSASVSAESAGTHCATGGVRVQVGSTEPTYICTGATGERGANGQGASVTPEPEGTNCVNGGVKVEVGSASATYVCGGANGEDGLPGNDGQSASVTYEPPPTNCINGGVKIQVGSGAPSYICNGADGADGQGATVTPEPAGDNCENAGVKVQVGGGTPSFVCNGNPSGPCGDDALPVINSFSMTAGLPFKATVDVTYSGDGPLELQFGGHPGTFIQTAFTNPYQFDVVLSDAGGPFSFDVTATDGCVFAIRTLTGVYTPPAAVSAVSAVPSYSVVALSWTNPTDANFDHVEISGVGFPTANVARPVSSATITGLITGQPYTFVLKAMDAHGSRSTGVEIGATPVAGKVIFVTRSTFSTSNFGGVANLDATCNSLGNRIKPGRYIALVSSAASAYDRVVNAYNAGYFLPDLTTKVAASKSDLFDGTIMHGIDMDEYGAAALATWVWTGSYATGATGSTCFEWTQGGDPSSGAIIGATSRVDAAWSFYSIGACGSLYPIY